MSREYPWWSAERDEGAAWAYFDDGREALLHLRQSRAYIDGVSVAVGRGQGPTVPATWFDGGHESLEGPNGTGALTYTPENMGLAPGQHYFGRIGTGDDSPRFVLTGGQMFLDRLPPPVPEELRTYARSKGLTLIDTVFDALPDARVMSPVAEVRPGSEGGVRTVCFDLSGGGMITEVLSVTTDVAVCAVRYDDGPWVLFDRRGSGAVERHLAAFAAAEGAPAPSPTPEARERFALLADTVWTGIVRKEAGL